MTEDLVLNVSRLRILRELAHRGSITAVAEALWLTPSAVSQQLSTLERETRVQLIERVGRGVQLTAAGKLLADHSERGFEALDEATAALRALQGEPRGKLRVASFPSVVRVVLPPIMMRLRSRFPDLRLEVQDLEGEQSLEAIRLGHVDVAVIDDLTWSATRRRDGLRRTDLFGTPLVVAFASGGAGPGSTSSNGARSATSRRSPSTALPSSPAVSRTSAGVPASRPRSTRACTTPARCSHWSKAAT